MKEEQAEEVKHFSMDLEFLGWGSGRTKGSFPLSHLTPSGTGIQAHAVGSNDRSGQGERTRGDRGGEAVTSREQKSGRPGLRSQMLTAFANI